MKKILLSIVCVLGSLLTNAQVGAALSFSGSGDFVQLTDPNFGTSNFTLETWMKPNTTAGAYLITTRSVEMGGAGGWFVLGYNAGKIGLESGTAGVGSFYFETAGTPVTVGAWNHVAFVRSGLQFSIYVNGILSASYTDTGLRNFNTGTNSIRLSGWANVGVAFFDGMMDETRFWNVARTPCQIYSFMNCEIPTTATGLIGNYHFNQGVAAGTNSGVTSLTDNSGSSRTGTLNNFALTGATSNWIAPGGVVSGYTTTSPAITANSGVITSGSSFTIIPGGGVSYTYTPSGPVVTPTVMTNYTVTGAAANGCTNTAVSTVSIQAGEALNFDGANDFVDCGNIMPSTYSKEAWIYITSLGLQNNVISGGGDGQHALYPSTSYGNRLSAGHNGAWNAVQDPTPMVANTWYHVALTYDAATTTMKMYKNGVLVASNASIPPFVGGNALRIGSFDPAQNLFGGKIDEVRVWNRVLCQSEIQNNRNAELPAGQVGLVAYYKMNQGVASAANPTVTTLTDASGNSNNGTLTSFALSGSTSNWVAPGAVVTGSLAPAFASPTVTIAGVNTICNGTPTTFTASGANTYAWFSGQTTSTIAVTPSVTTSYTVVGTNAAGCTSGMIVKTLIVNSTPTITATSGSIIASASITIVPNGGISYTYSPSGPVVSPTTSVTYTVTGINASGCTNTTVTTVSVQGTSLNMDGTNDYVLTNSNALLNFGNAQDFTLEANFKTSFSQPNYAGVIVKAGLGTFTGYQLVIYNNHIAAEFSDGTTMIGVGNGLEGTTLLNNNTWHHLAMVVDRSKNNIKLLVDGVVEANVTHTVISSNISNTSNMFIGSERGNSAYVRGTMDEVRIWNRALCQGEIQNNKNAELSSGQTGLVAYYKINQGFAALVNPTVSSLTDASGNNLNGTLTNFALTGTTSNWVSPGAVNTGSLSPAFVSPVISVVGATTICSGASTTFTASGNVSTYVWTSGPSTATYSVTPLVNTTYSVVGTNSLGCVSNMTTKSVTVNATPTVSVTSGAICFGNSFTMVPSGASTYTYSSGSAVVSPTANTSYNVAGTSALGCVSSNTAVSSVTVNTLPIISVNSGAICVGQSFTMVPMGAATYTYSNGTDVVMPTADATYSVSGTDANGCVSSMDAISSVTVNALPTISVNSGAICAGQSFTMVPTGATTYTYSNGTDVVMPTSDATYSVSGTDANGCMSSVDAVSSVTVNALPTISVNSGAICAGQSFTMVPTGATTYTYSNGTDVVMPTADATYSVSGTDANGCVSSVDAVSSVTVNVLPIISVNSGAICAGQSFTMVPTGATTYTYSNGTDVVIPTADATYSVSGTDANGCVSSTEAVSSVTVNTLPTISVNSGAICAGQSFTMVPTGATTYTYSNGTDVVMPTADATYSVSGTDVNGCVSSMDATSSVTVNALPTLFTSTTNTLLCTGETATLSVTGATSYTWSTAETTSDIAVTPTIQTTYTVDGIDANGCASSTTIMQDVSLCTAIVTLSNSNSAINVYPNPNNGLFTIELIATADVIVTNAIGQVVLTEKMEDGKHSIDIQNQATGIYFVKLIQDGKQHVIKVIKE